MSIDKKEMQKMAEVIAATSIPFGGPLAAMYMALSRSQEEVKAAESEGLLSLEDEAKKQHVMMEFQSHQARVAQEISIAHRINCSAEVEIEEFYDDSSSKGGEAELRVSARPSAKLSGQSERRGVVKRVYRFTGGGVDGVSLDGFSPSPNT